MNRDEIMKDQARDCYGASMFLFAAAAGVYYWCDLDWLVIALVTLEMAFLFAGLYIERRKR